MPATQEIKALTVVSPNIFVDIAVEILLIDDILFLACSTIHDAQTIQIAFITIMRHALPSNIFTIGRKLGIGVIAHLHIALLLVDLLMFKRFCRINLWSDIAFGLTQVGGFSRAYFVQINICIGGDGILHALFLAAGVGNKLRIGAPSNLFYTAKGRNGGFKRLTSHDVCSCCNAVSCNICNKWVQDFSNIMIPMSIVHIGDEHTCRLREICWCFFDCTMIGETLQHDNPFSIGRESKSFYFSTSVRKLLTLSTCHIHRPYFATAYENYFIS